MRENPDGFPSCSLSGISKGLIQDWILLATIESRRNKVMAGETPANPAVME
jgi:hypothetical protein